MCEFSREMRTFSTYLAVLELCVIGPAMVGSVLWGVAMARSQLITTQTKLLLLNGVVCTMGYLPTRIYLLILTLNTNYYDILCSSNNLVACFHNWFLSTKYFSLGTSALLVYWTRNHSRAVSGVVGGLFTILYCLPMWLISVPALTGSNYGYEVTLIYTVIYTVGLVASAYIVFVLKLHNANLYCGRSLSLRDKTRVSIQLRSLDVMNKVTVLSLYRYALCMVLLFFNLLYLVPRCLSTESQLLSFVHDIAFELFDVLIPLAVLSMMPAMRSRLWCWRRTVIPLRNVLGQSIPVGYDPEQHQNAVYGMWRTGHNL